MNVTVPEKGGVVIPAELRRKHNLRYGTRIQVVDYCEMAASEKALTDFSDLSTFLTSVLLQKPSV